ncbi:GcrA family cell cycle regulator [Brevundimonas sp.]|uniref:GcrA family cell cycle regulator n=1 Tax=Brevundimonas sp. TaxID=1871086 RepID=UPI002D5159F9|nr:GcrA family cell cycle regulator [Brevundimonas sp.]HYC66667.1 GcrA family cell cycle regulator [Brevundimonas sp.]
MSVHDFNWKAPGVVDQLEQLWRSGHSASQIAAKMGLSRNAVIGKCQRLGLTAASRLDGVKLIRKTYTFVRKGVLVQDTMPPRARAMKAPPVRSGPASPRGAKRTPPRQGPHLKPGAVFGPVATLDPAEALKRSSAAAEAGKKLVDAFAAPANDDAILLLERRFGQCSWPVGEPDRPANQMCCGQPVDLFANRGIPTYCAAHGTRAVSRTRLGGAPDAKAYERSLRRVA